MKKLLLAALLLVEIFTFANQGGGPLLSYLFLTIAVVGTAALFIIAKTRLAIRSITAFASFALFLGLFVISLFTSLTPNYGFSELLLFVNSLVLFLLVSSLNFEEKHIEWFAKLFVGLAIVASLIGFYFYISYAMPRVAGTFFRFTEPQHAAFNAFANMLLFALPLCALFYFKPSARRSWVVGWGIIFSILTAALILTFSRAAWISFGASALVYFIWRIAGEKPLLQSAKRLMIALSLAVVIVASLQTIRVQKFETTSVIDKILFRADEGDASAGERKEYWAAAVKLIQRRPFLGSGIGSFRYLYPSLQSRFGIAEDHPHNIFLKIGVENGIPAAAAFFFFLSLVIFIAIRFITKNTESPHKFLLLGFAAALGHNILDFNFITSNFTLFVVSAGLLVGAARSAQGYSISPWLAAPFVVFLLGFSTHEGYYNFFLKKSRAEFLQNNPIAAVALLEKAEPLWFDRDREKLLLGALNEAYRRCNEQDCAQRIRDKRLAQVQTRSIDAERINQSGDILRDLRQPEEAKKYYQKALELDPANSLEYYYDLYVNGGPPDLPKKIERTLLQYNEVLARNQHFTVLTENPRYGAELWRLLGNPDKQKKFNELWALEREKFEAKYGTIQPK